MAREYPSVLELVGDTPIVRLDSLGRGVEPRLRRPVLGYAMVFAAATLFGVNGSVAKIALASGLSSLRLTEARCAGACVGLVLIVLIRSPRSLHVDRRSFLRLAVFGVVGVALVQLFYFLAIHRLQIGIASPSLGYIACEPSATQATTCVPAVCQSTS